MLAAVFAGALKVVLLLQLVLTVCRELQEVHIADGQLLALGDLPQSPHLDPGTEEEEKEKEGDLSVWTNQS